MKNTEPEFVSLALDQIRPSPHNPRKTFKQDALDELAKSIASKGVLEPILVRPRTLWQRVCGYLMVHHQMAVNDERPGSMFKKGDLEGAGITFASKKQFELVINALIEYGRAEEMKPGKDTWATLAAALDSVTDKDPFGLGVDHYQLIAGERRLRASAIAGKETIPALVRDLDDKEAAEIQVIENDQREDVPPLEQAEGYKRLIDLGDDVESIAAKIGRRPKYVTARLTLVNLIEPLKEDLRSGKLPFGHAHLLARLPAAEQTAVLNDWDLYLNEWQGGGAVPLNALRRELREEFIGALDTSAPWMRTDDEDLVPAAGSCAKCPKRAGANRTLFDELFEGEPLIETNGKPTKNKHLTDHCTDRTCYAGKKAAFIELLIKKTAEKTGAEPLKVSSHYSSRDGVIGLDKYEESDAKTAKTDPSVKPAIISDGEHAGKVIYVREKKKGTGRGDATWAKQEKERRETAKAENAARIVALGKVAEEINGPRHTYDMQRALVTAMTKVAGGEVCGWVANRRGLPEAKNKWEQDKRIQKHAEDLETGIEIEALIAELIAGKYGQFSWTDPSEKNFWSEFGIDRGKLVKEAAAVLNGNKPAAKKPAKAKKRKAGAK